MNLNKIVKDKQIYNNEEKPFDPDSSPEAIEYYKKIYKNHFKLFSEFEADDSKVVKADDSDDGKSKRYSRIHFKIKSNSKYLQEFESEFKISGDIDFNFNEKKYEYFEPLLKENKKYLKKLKCFRDNRHHSLINMSLMPTTGALNTIKGFKSSFDRHDKFLFSLNNYYNFGCDRIFTFSENNEESIRSFLNQFTDIYDYCKNFYFIEDKNLINDLIKSGEQRIYFYKSNNTDESKKINADFLINYMNLAERYWEEKAKNIKKHLKNL